MKNNKILKCSKFPLRNPIPKQKLELLKGIFIFKFRMSIICFKSCNLTLLYRTNRSCHQRPATLFKKRLWHTCFPVNFAKSLRTPFLQNTSGRLLLNKIKPTRSVKIHIYEMQIHYQKIVAKIAQIHQRITSATHFQTSKGIHILKPSQAYNRL